MTAGGHNESATAMRAAPAGAARRDVDARSGSEQAPVLSVVMPVYNAKGTLEECLTRLFQSGFEGFEVIVVDDGCTDGSREIMPAGRPGPSGWFRSCSEPGCQSISTLRPRTNSAR